MLIWGITYDELGQILVMGIDTELFKLFSGTIWKSRLVRLQEKNGEWLLAVEASQNTRFGIMLKKGIKYYEILCKKTIKRR